MLYNQFGINFGKYCWHVVRACAVFQPDPCTIRRLRTADKWIKILVV